MRVGAIIFSRMSSKRLPGKALIDLSGKSLLERVIEGVKSIKQIDHISLATTKNIEDNQIAVLAKKLGVQVFRGSENDVAIRAFNTSIKYGYESFARICGDRPFINGNIYDELISSHNKNNADITTNTFPRVVPPGLSAEIIRVNSLKDLISLTIKKSDREHITKYFYNNSKKFKILSINHNNNFKKFINTKLVIDYPKDLQKVRWILENHREQNGNLDSESIIKMANEWEANYIKTKLTN